MAQTQSTQEQRIRRSIADAVAAFQKGRMSGAPCSVAVSLQPDAVVITLRGIMSPAEKRLAEVGKDREELLQEFYSRAFELGKAELESKIADIVRRKVAHSFLHMDADSGGAVIMVTLEGAPSASHGEVKA